MSPDRVDLFEPVHDAIFCNTYLALKRKCHTRLFATFCFAIRSIRLVHMPISNPLWRDQQVWRVHFFYQFRYGGHLRGHIF
jgi:hypothetical protein